MGVSENSGTPKSSILIGFFHDKPSILGYPYFRKHPYSGREETCQKRICKRQGVHKKNWEGFGEVKVVVNEVLRNRDRLLTFWQNSWIWVLGLKKGVPESTRIYSIFLPGPPCWFSPLFPLSLQAICERHMLREDSVRMTSRRQEDVPWQVMKNCG